MVNGHHIVRLEVTGALEMLNLLQVASDQIACSVGLDQDTSHWVSVAVRESVINAIHHGNRDDDAKHVVVEFTKTASALILRVRDQGAGFDPEDIADPLAPEACFAICAGLMTGHKTPFSGRIQIVGKSPLTGTWADSNSGGSVCIHLRKAGYSRPAVGLYQLAVALDAPVQLAGLTLQYLWRRLRGRAAAAKSLLAARGVGHFLTRGLPSFWRA